MPKYVFDHQEEIKKQLDQAPKITLFLDYDGTLAGFENKPEKVTTPPPVKKVLEELSTTSYYDVFIISGRKLGELKERIEISQLSFIAVHGMLMEFADGERFTWEKAEEIRPLLEQIREHGLRHFKDEKGVHFEDKELTLAFHYRQLSKEKVKPIITAFLNLVQNIDRNDTLEVIHGERVLEVRPKGWDKGKAVQHVLQNKQKEKPVFPVYVGDDTTDEDAFRFLGEEGITIFVANDSKCTTSAQYWLKNPSEVLRFLQWLTQDS